MRGVWTTSDRGGSVAERPVTERTRWSRPCSKAPLAPWSLVSCSIRWRPPSLSSSSCRTLIDNTYSEYQSINQSIWRNVLGNQLQFDLLPVVPGCLNMIMSIMTATDLLSTMSYVHTACRTLHGSRSGFYCSVIHRQGNRWSCGDWLTACLGTSLLHANTEEISEYNGLRVYT